MPLIKPEGFAIKTVVELSRDQMKLFQDFEAMLTRMNLQFWMRCKRCMKRQEASDGVWGNNNSNASQYVVECACSKRIYKGADVKLPS